MVKMLRQRRNYVITLACISLLLLGGCASALPDAKAGNDQHDTDTVVVRVNQPLVANAGSDQVVSPGTTVRLDASGSFGSSISYVWKEDGTNISTKKSFSKTYSAGRHEVTLTVTDSLGNQDDDTAFVVVNRAPVADAGPDRTVTEETSVHFDGSNSSDPDGDSISYRWKEDGGAVLNAAPSFDMPLSCGAHRIMLEVTDVYGAVSAPDYVVIDVLPVYQEPPVAEAGADQTVLVGTNVTLDASGSYDSDGTIAKYEWREADANATLCESVSFERQFPRGVHNIVLTVTDSSGASATDEVVVMVRTSMDMPVADAGMDERVTLEGSEVLLDASGSSGENLTYRWIENGTLLSEEPVFGHLFDQGTRTVTLVVTDYYGSTDSAEIIVVTVTRGAAGDAHTAPDTRTGGKLSQYAAALVLLLAIAGIAIVFMRRKSSQQEPSYGSITGSIGGQKSGKDPEKQKSSKKEPKKQSKKQSKKDSRKQSDKHPPSKPKSESKPKSKSKSKTAVGDTKIADKPGIKAVVPEPDLDLSVKVLDESTKVPIPGVIIHLGPKTLKTGDNGVATFTVGSGEQTIDVHGIPNLYDSATTSVSVSADSRTVTLLLSSVVRPDHEQDTRLRSIRQAFENRYREVSGYDRCIPGFYRSMVQRQIEYVRGMTADHFIRGKHTPKEVTNRFEVVSARISETMVSKRNIDLYATGASGAGSTSVCAASQIGHDLLANLLSDLPGFISSEYPGVQQIKSKNMSVLPVTGIWTIAKDLISDRSGDDLDRALRVLIAKVLLKHAREMYENPEIVKRMESGVL
jgi:hypothetical protein